MWRAALALALVSGTACGKQADDGPAVVAGAPAGTVVAIDGTVTAGARTLAKGDTVTADDEIATADGAHVTIELAHNHARWSLGPKRHEKPRDAAAWRLAKADGSADGVHATATSAGRDGERSAADTDINTPATATAQPAGGEAVPPPTPGTATTPPAQKPEVERAPKTASHVGSRPAPTSPPPPPPTLEQTPKGDNEKVADLEVSDKRAPISSATRAQQILAKDGALRACLAHAATAELTVRCDAGACKVTKFTATDGPRRLDAHDDQACVAARVGKLGLPQGTYEVTVALKAPER